MKDVPFTTEAEVRRIVHEEIAAAEKGLISRITGLIPKILRSAIQSPRYRGRDV